MTKKAKASKNMHQYSNIKKGYAKTFKRFPIPRLEIKKKESKKINDNV